MIKQFLPLLAAAALCAPLGMLTARSGTDGQTTSNAITTIEVTQLSGGTAFLVAFTPGRSFTNIDGLVNWENGGPVLEFRYFPSDPSMVEAYLAVLQFPGEIQPGQNNLGGLVQYRDANSGEVFNCEVVSGSAEISQAGQLLTGTFTMSAEQCFSMQTSGVTGNSVQINGSFENVRPD